MTSSRRISFVVLLFALVSSSAFAQDAVAPPVTLKGLDGKLVKVFDTGGKKALVLFFVSPYCPTSNNFAPEMTAIEGDFTDAFSFRYIHSDPSVKSADILQHASMMGFVSPVLDDTAQVVAKQLRAKTTPEVVVIDPAGIVLYQGRINDLYLGPTKRQREVKTNDLRDALTAIQTGRPVATPWIEAIGCKIHGVE